MTQVLNLDDLETGVEKTIILKGVKHSFAPFSVENFIENLKTLERYSNQDEVPVSEYMEHMIDMVSRGFPSLGLETIRQMPMTQLKAINDFIQGQTEMEAAAGAASAGQEVTKN
jgi:hypothetical protein